MDMSVKACRKVTTTERTNQRDNQNEDHN